jgi:glutamate-5-semialdehyde dehydrogenase
MSESSAHDFAKAAKAAFESSQLIPASERVKALHEIRNVLERSKDEVLEANKQDLQV